MTGGLLSGGQESGSETVELDMTSPQARGPETEASGPETVELDMSRLDMSGIDIGRHDALVSSAWDDPLTGSAPDQLSLVELARMVGGYRWVEFRMFEVLGAWVASESQAEARLMFDVQSRQHAWHAQLWADRLPSVEGVVDPDLVSVAPAEGTVEFFATLGGVRNGESAGGGTLLRLVGLARVVLPRLACGYAFHLRKAVSVSDSAVVRALRLALRDETEAWQSAELMVQSLIRRPHDIEVVTAHQQRLEALVAGTGPGLVPWSGEQSR